MSLLSDIKGIVDPGGDPTAIHNAATAFRNLATSLRGVASDLDNAVSTNIEAHWKGKASAAFQKQWSGFSTAITNYASSLDGAADQLDQIANELHNAHEQVRNLIIVAIASIAVGAALTFFTFGGSDAAAAAEVGADVAEAGDVIATADEAATEVVTGLARFLADDPMSRFQMVAARFAMGSGISLAQEMGTKLVADHENPFDLANYSAEDISNVILGGTLTAGLGMLGFDASVAAKAGAGTRLAGLGDLLNGTVRNEVGDITGTSWAKAGLGNAAYGTAGGLLGSSISQFGLNGKGLSPGTLGTIALSGGISGGFGGVMGAGFTKLNGGTLRGDSADGADGGTGGVSLGLPKGDLSAPTVPDPTAPTTGTGGDPGGSVPPGSPPANGQPDGTLAGGSPAGGTPAGTPAGDPSGAAGTPAGGTPAGTPAGDPSGAAGTPAGGTPAGTPAGDPSGAAGTPAGGTPAGTPAGDPSGAAGTPAGGTPAGTPAGDPSGAAGTPAGGTPAGTPAGDPSAAAGTPAGGAPAGAHGGGPDPAAGTPPLSHDEVDSLQSRINDLRAKAATAAQGRFLRPANPDQADAYNSQADNLQRILNLDKKAGGTDSPFEAEALRERVQTLAAKYAPDLRPPESPAAGSSAAGDGGATGSAPTPDAGSATAPPPDGGATPAAAAPGAIKSALGNLSEKTGISKGDVVRATIGIPSGAATYAFNFPHTTEPSVPNPPASPPSVPVPHVPPPPPPPPPPPHIGGGSVTVQPGDSLYHIAGQRLGNPNLYPLIQAANPGAVGPNGLIHPGQVLHIPKLPPLPPDSTAQVVQPGQDLWEIAGGDPALVQRIAKLNHLNDPSLILPGQVLIVPPAA